MRYDVKAQVFMRSDGSPVRIKGKVVPARVERVDLNKNVLFSMCRTILDVKASYEAFWNDLDSRSSHSHVVFVQRITPVKD